MGIFHLQDKQRILLLLIFDIWMKHFPQVYHQYGVLSLDICYTSNLVCQQVCLLLHYTNESMHHNLQRKLNFSGLFFYINYIDTFQMVLQYPIFSHKSSLLFSPCLHVILSFPYYLSVISISPLKRQAFQLLTQDYQHKGPPRDNLYKIL